MRKVHFFPVSFLFVLANGCEGAEKSPEKEVACTLEAAPVAQPVPGDANGDGHFDVSDGVYYQRSYLAGGPPPVCVEAVDMTPDENPDFGDATAMWFHLGPNRTTEMPKAANCAFPTREVEPACANGLALGIDAPATVNGAAGTATPFEAKVTLTSPMLKVEAWSF
ncbi:MAG TPA: hypothetical protein PKW90_04695, partial [Myxococcota bacterium]|nr:hypothetical protein [Myxococcota bacterium]